MNTLSHLLRRRGLILAAALLAPGLRALAEDAPAQPDAFPNFESYIKITGTAPFITGDRAEFATRTGVPNTGAGGIQDLYYAKDLSDTRSLTFDGRALAGTDDYLAQLKIDDSNLGSVDV